MKTIKLTWRLDAGHGWLQVPFCFVTTPLLEEISEFSYIDDDFLYLEEDCDAAKFINYYGADNIEFDEDVSITPRSVIRALPRFSKKRANYIEQRAIEQFVTGMKSAYEVA